MVDVLRELVGELDSLDGAGLTPRQRGDRRETAIIRGLHALAASFGIGIEPTRINALGEFQFFTASPTGAKLDRPDFGAGLAEMLSLVPRRTGAGAYAGPAASFNNWCWLNHFDAEKLVRLAAARLSPEPDAGSAASPSPR
jgi:hypothetical protein